MPRQKPTLASSSPAFLFVNKDVQSGSLSNSREDASSLYAIQHHAQMSRRRYKKKVEGVRRARRDLLPRPTTTVVGWERGPPAHGKVPEDRTPQINSSQKVRSDQPPKSHYSEEAALYDSKVRGQRRRRPSSLRDILVGDPVDAFRCSAVQLDSGKHRILQYFISTWEPGSVRWAFRGTPKNYQQDCFDFSDIVRGCLADAMHMSVILAAASSRMKHISGLILERIDIPESFVAQAIRLLRQYLEAGKAITSQTILDIHLLASVEVYFRQFENARCYYRIIRFLTRYGGLDQIQPYVREVCRSGDLFIASSTGSSPLLDLGRQSRPSSVPWSSDSLGVSTLNHATFFSVQMRSLTDDVVLYARASQHFQSTSVHTAETSLTQQRGSLIHRLLSMPVDISNGPSIQALQEEICRLAFLIWLSNDASGVTGLPLQSNEPKSFKLIMPGNVTRMRLAVQASEQLLHTLNWNAHNNMLLWITGLGALSSTALEDRMYFRRNFAQTASILDISTEGQLSTIFEGYLSLNRIARDSLTKLAAEISFHKQQSPITSNEDALTTKTHIQAGPFGVHILHVTAGFAPWT